MDEGKVLARELIPGLDHVANCLNALDTEGMTANEVRSAIYSECLQPGCRIALSAAPSEEVVVSSIRNVEVGHPFNDGTRQTLSDALCDGLNCHPTDDSASDVYEALHAIARAAISSMGGLANGPWRCPSCYAISERIPDVDEHLSAVTLARKQALEEAAKVAIKVGTEVADAAIGQGHSVSRAKQVNGPKNPNAHRLAELQVGALRARDGIATAIRALIQPRGEG